MCYYYSSKPGAVIGIVAGIDCPCLSMGHAGALLKRSASALNRWCCVVVSSCHEKCRGPTTHSTRGEDVVVTTYFEESEQAVI